jgi:hypothetical protein
MAPLLFKLTAGVYFWPAVRRVRRPVLDIP